jgi:hypothetical protein
MDASTSTPALTSEEDNEDADKPNSKEVGAERNGSLNPSVGHILDMNYPWNTTFNVPSTTAFDHAGKAPLR